MIKNAEKTELVAQIHAEFHDQSLVSMVKLLNILISDRRKLADDCLPAELTRIQGQISAFKQIVDYIEKGIPEPMPAEKYRM
jgi:hypothetical protein